jgi:hypothetical protein
VVNPVRWYTFTMNQLEGPQDIPANATINTTKFILNDNEALVVGPFFSPVESTQLWLHTQSSLGGRRDQLEGCHLENRRRLQPGAWHAADFHVPADDAAPVDQ